MKTPEHRWRKLVVVARVPAAADADLPGAPLGFASRVVARAMEAAREESWEALLQSRLWRALAGAGLLAAVSVAINYPVIAQTIEREVLAGEDPVVALVEDWS